MLMLVVNCNTSNTQQTLQVSKMKRPTIFVFSGISSVKQMEDVNSMNRKFISEFYDTIAFRNIYQN